MDSSRMSLNRTRLKRLLIGEWSWKRVIRSTVLIYGIVFIFAVVWSERIIFIDGLCSYRELPGAVSIPTPAGNRVTAWYRPHTKAVFTILHSHGNGEDLGDLQDYFNDYHRQGYSLFAYDYPGYGTSPGRASEQGTYDAVEAAWNYLTNTLQIPPDRIILHGRSVGSGPAVWLAGRVRPAGLIVESGFVSAFRVMTRIPLLPFDRFPNLKRLPLVTCPMLFIHGAGDPVIKAWHGRALAKAAGDRGTQCIIEGAGHNDVSWVRRKKYWDAIRRFADSLDGRINRSAVLPQAGE